MMAWGKTREEAISRMKRALEEMRIGGVATSIPFHRVVLDDEVFNSGWHTTDFVEKQNILTKLRKSTQK
jgi:pyruvate carboxylase